MAEDCTTNSGVSRMFSCLGRVIEIAAPLKKNHNYLSIFPHDGSAIYVLQGLNFLSLKLYTLPPKTAASICPPPSYDPDNMKLRLISLRLKQTKGKSQKTTWLVAPCSRGNFSGKLIRRVDGRSGDTTCRAMRVIFRRSFFKVAFSFRVLCLELWIKSSFPSNGYIFRSSEHP